MTASVAMTHPWQSVMRGAVAGDAATLPMTVAMRAVRRRLPLYERRKLPPRKIVETLFAKAGIRRQTSLNTERKSAAAAHYLFGSGGGAALAAIAPRLPMPRWTSGILVGLAIWAVSYLGWLPATGLHRSARRESPGRNWQMILAHLVWGATAGVVLTVLERIGLRSGPLLSGAPVQKARS